MNISFWLFLFFVLSSPSDDVDGKKSFIWFLQMFGIFFLLIFWQLLLKVFCQAPSLVFPYVIPTAVITPHPLFMRMIAT